VQWDRLDCFVPVMIGRVVVCQVKVAAATAHNTEQCMGRNIPPGAITLVGRGSS
jgi:hypothetical protein